MGSDHRRRPLSTPAAGLRTFVLGGVLGVGIVSGGALAFAQSSGTTAPPTTETPGTAPGTTAPGTSAPGTTAPGTTTPPAAGEAPAPPGTTPAPPAEGDKGRGKGRGGHRGGKAGGHLRASADDLAKELGVTVDQLREASKAARQAVRDQLGEHTRPATRPPSDEDKATRAEDLKARAELYTKTLAEKLGVTPERLRDAGIAVVSKRLDEAVTAGKLTREQADKLLAKVREGSAGDLLGRGALGFDGKGGHGPGGQGGRGPGAPGENATPPAGS